MALSGDFLEKKTTKKRGKKRSLSERKTIKNRAMPSCPRSNLVLCFALHKTRVPSANSQKNKKNFSKNEKIL